MKRFIGMVLCATLLFFGIGALIDQVGARFKSDEKALALLRKARQAIGGESAIGEVRSMSISGKTTLSLEVDGAARTETGNLELNFELPNKMSRTLKIGNGDGGNAIVDKQVDVIVIKKGDGNVEWTSRGDAGNGDVKKTIVLRKKDGTEEVVTEDVIGPRSDGTKKVIVTTKDENGRVITEDVRPVIVRRTDGGNATWTSEDGKTIDVDGKKVFIRKADAGGTNEAMHHRNELFRTTLALLLSAPEGLDVSYTYAGEGSVDGSGVEIIDAAIGDTVVKLYLDKTTSLPRMISYKNFKPMMLFIRKAEGGKTEPAEIEKVVSRPVEAPEMAEYQVKYSDYRSVGGLLLPFRWTQTVGSNTETTEVASYEINPANIAEKFKDAPKTMVFKTTKP